MITEMKSFPYRKTERAWHFLNLRKENKAGMWLLSLAIPGEGQSKKKHLQIYKYFVSHSLPAENTCHLPREVNFKKMQEKKRFFNRR